MLATVLYITSCRIIIQYVFSLRFACKQFVSLFSICCACLQIYIYMHVYVCYICACLPTNKGVRTCDQMHGAIVLV